MREAYSIRGLMGKVRQDVAPQSLSPCLLPALHKRVENAFQLTPMNLMTIAATPPVDCRASEYCTGRASGTHWYLCRCVPSPAYFNGYLLD